MPSITIIGRDGRGQTVDAADGLSTMEVIRNAGFDELLALCGGCCSCATCHVYVDEQHFGALPEMTSDEDDLLDSSNERRATSRLSASFGSPPGWTA